MNFGSKFTSQLFRLSKCRFSFRVSMKFLKADAFAIPGFTIIFVNLNRLIKVLNCLIVFTQ